MVSRRVLNPGRVLGVLVLLLTACTPRPGPPDPFAGGASARRDGVRVTRVRLEVVCDGCSIRYFVGSNSTQASADQVWSHSLNLTPLIPTAIRLLATPTVDGKPVREMRIWVDGDVQASMGCSSCRDGTNEIINTDRSTKTIEVVIPLER
ncbi:MAG: hypothetical protein AAF389_08305 [Gemmatimonadota bacterium]